MINPPGFNIADVIALIMIVIGIGVGFRHGLSAQMAVLLIALSSWASLANGFEPCRNWLVSQYALPPELARMATLVILITIPVIVVALLYSLLRFVLKITFTTWIDRVGGAVAGGITTAGIVLLVFLLLNYLPPERRPDITGTQSWIGREVIGVETQLVQTLSARLDKGTNALERARAKHAGQREKWEQ